MGDTFLITGTDTGVGKTYVASLILEGCLQSGVDAFAVKPVESGCLLSSDGVLLPADAGRYLSLLQNGKTTLEDICYYRFREPISPNIAARRTGDIPDPAFIREKIGVEAERHDVLLVEGAGGIMVEILDGYSFLDLASDMGMKVIIVAPNRLGVLNQVALNVRMLGALHLGIEGIILNDLSEIADESARYNYKELRRVHGELVLGHISFNGKEIPGDIIEKLARDAC